MRGTDMNKKSDIAKLKMSDILCDEYGLPKRFPDKFLDKHRSAYKCVFSNVGTRMLTNYFNDSDPVTYVLGNTCDAPTGEKYVKIHIEADDMEEAEGVLLCLLREYRKRSIKNGNKFLYWRLRPYLTQELQRDGKWRGRARLLYSKKDARKILRESK